MAVAPADDNLLGFLDHDRDFFFRLDVGLNLAGQVPGTFVVHIAFVDDVSYDDDNSILAYISTARVAPRRNTYHARIDVREVVFANVVLISLRLIVDYNSFLDKLDQFHFRGLL